ncbi:MAG TPA: DUF5011 domain-containing protein [bacterium]|nr:DUF5011 domain-containing protein [bacterium]
MKQNITKIQTPTKVSIKTRLLLTFIMIISIGIIFAVVIKTSENIDIEENKKEEIINKSIDEHTKTEEIENNTQYHKEYPELGLEEVTLEEYPRSQLEQVTLVAVITSDILNQESIKEKSVFKLDGSKSTVTFDNNASSDIYHETEYKWNHCEHVNLVKQDGGMAEFSVSEVNKDEECLISLRIVYGRNISEPETITFKIENATEIQELDNIAPEIILNGENPTYIAVGEPYTEFGATAIDNIDGAVLVRINGSVNTDTEGTYEIIYTSTDSTGNTSTITRTIIVSLESSNFGNKIINPGINYDKDENQDTKVSDEEADEINWTNGKWVKTPDRSTVYFVDNKNIRHAYPHESIWLSYFDKNFFSNVEIISNQELMQYPLGKNVIFKPETLIKIPSIRNVYKVIDNSGKIKWIKSETTATKLFGDNWNSLVKDLNEVFFNDYIKDGEIK